MGMVEEFMKEHPHIKRVRSIAKILHGFQSPLYPWATWAKTTYWGKQTHFPFAQIMQMTRNIKNEKRHIMKEMTKKGGRHNPEEESSEEAVLVIDEAEHSSDESDSEEEDGSDDEEDGDEEQKNEEEDADDD